MTDTVLLTYSPEMQEAVAKMAEEMAKANAEQAPKKTTEYIIWDRYFFALLNNSCETTVEYCARSADAALLEFRKRYPDA